MGVLFMKCVNCGTELEEGVNFCLNCGCKVEPVKQEEIKCPKCGTVLSEAANFCFVCGTKIISCDEEGANSEETKIDDTLEDSNEDSDQEPGNDEIIENVDEIENNASNDDDNTPEHEESIEIHKENEQFYTQEDNNHHNYKSSLHSEYKERPARTTMPEFKEGKSINEKMDGLFEQFKAWTKETWAKLDLLEKAIVVFCGLSAIMLLIALIPGNTPGIILSVIQAVGGGICVLQHQDRLEVEKKWIRYAIFALPILLCILNVVSYSWLSPKGNTTTSSSKPAYTTEQAPKSTSTPTPDPLKEDAYAPISAADCVGQDYKEIAKKFSGAGFVTIFKYPQKEIDLDNISRIGEITDISIDSKKDFAEGDKFTRGSNIVINYLDVMQIATPISASDTVRMNAEELVGLFQEAGFTNFETEELYDIDPDASDEEIRTEVFIGDTKFFSEQDLFDINSKIKIIVHYPYEKYDVNVHINFIGNLLFNKYGVTILFDGKEILDLGHGEDGDFNLRVVPGTYTFTVKKHGFYNPKKEVEFEVKGNVEAIYNVFTNEDYIDVTLKEYVDYGAAGEDEVLITSTNSSYWFKDYKEVKKELEAAGFTNISTEPVYDIVLGFTDEESVDDVIIEGKTDYKRGDVFKKDAKIVIEYHLLASDDPNNSDSATTQSQKTTTATPTTTKAATTASDSKKETAKTTTEPTKAPTKATAEPTKAATKDDKKEGVILPQSGTKLAKDLDSKSKSSAIYMNIDGTSNTPKKTTWGEATVTDGVKDYLDYLKSQDCKVKVTSSSSNTPRKGYTVYESTFEATNGSTTWTMYLMIQDEDYIEYEFDIDLP